MPNFLCLYFTERPYMDNASSSKNTGVKEINLLPKKTTKKGIKFDSYNCEENKKGQ